MQREPDIVIRATGSDRVALYTVAGELLSWWRWPASWPKKNIDSCFKEFKWDGPKYIADLCVPQDHPETEGWPRRVHPIVWQV